MPLLEDLIGFITSGFIAGLPSIVFMVIPFILGFVIGLVLRKALKIGIIALIIIAVLTYFGLFNLSFEGLKDLVLKYGPIALHYGVILLGMVPLSIGLIIGVIIGFIVS
jgi:uncharacterized membrane protein (Fun14 family)